ncbi:MAG TPA: patatin-like phospholipase family protein [Bacteroidota bacterium]|nr:patatin-like phospholipase family protein [Bacteroidota bacterium]
MATLERIALTLSGGGYRAAAFHLGTLSYLRKAGLLEKVRVLSTVSGGTITGAKFAVSAKRGIPFEEFFRAMYSFLRDVDLVQLSLERIGDKRRGSALGFEDFITAFADLYDERLVPETRFGLFWEGRPCHLEEIIFNATEFKTGLPFRFQRSENGQPKIGNGNVWISHATARKIRIADIIAASTCFPGGFEPLAFPRDFQWPGEIPPDLGEMIDAPLSLMDGGIYDNQGIESALAAADRMKRRPDCFIISDTEPPRMTSYRYRARASLSNLSLGTVDGLTSMFIGLGGLSVLVLIGQMIFAANLNGINLVLLLSGLVPAIVILLAVGAASWIRHQLKREVIDRIPQQGSRSWNELRRLTVNQAIKLIDLRVTSLYSLATQVFTRRIRRVVYEKIFSDSRYANGRISNLIFDLTAEKTRSSHLGRRKSPLLQEIADEATRMPTTLWFTNESQLKMLVACGQFTMCYNISEFIHRGYGAQRSRYPRSIQSLYDTADEDWARFERDPYMMLDAPEGESRIGTHSGRS